MINVIVIEYLCSKLNVFNNNLNFSGEFFSSDWQIFFWRTARKYYSAARGRWKIWLQCQQQVSILYWGMSNLYQSSSFLRNINSTKSTIFDVDNYKITSMENFDFAGLSISRPSGLLWASAVSMGLFFDLVITLF